MSRFARPWEPADGGSPADDQDGCAVKQGEAFMACGVAGLIDKLPAT
ncbi:MAG: hypothetical protein MUF54_02300 [Polyangiaceae bacterium]|nr:hypothetical protein [Polyangiaceae bacterium]